MFVVCFFILFLFYLCGYYIWHKYQQSVRKELFLKTGNYRSLAVILTLLTVVPAVIYFLLPEIHLSLTPSTRYVTDSDNLKELLWAGKIHYYFELTIGTFLQNITVVSFIAAFIILVTWFIYITKLDIFNKEKQSITLLTVALGMVFSFLAILLSDVILFAFDIYYRDQPVYDFFAYCVARIGLIEEATKLLPILLLLAFTKVIDEPYDIIYYAAASALGFAFVENLFYFNSLKDQVIQNRALISVFGHIMFSSFAAYGYVLGKYKEKKNVAGYFVLTYLIAALLHGLFNYLALNNFTPALFFLFFFSVQAWAIIVNNAINNSPYFSYQVAWQAEKQRYFLAIMFSGMIVLNYFIDVVQLGKPEATAAFIPSFFLGLGLAFFYVSNLLNFDLVQGYWRPIKIDYFKEPPPPNTYGRGVRNPMMLLRMNFLVAQNIVGYQIMLKAPHFNQWLFVCLRQSEGSVINRICVVKQKNNREEVDPDWFLVELESTIQTQDYHSRLILVKLKNKMESLIHEEYVEVNVKLLPKDFLLTGNRIKSTQLKSCGDARISLATLPQHINA